MKIFFNKPSYFPGFPPEYMIVFDTDYSNYAGVFFCSQMGIASESKIYILSRTTKLTDNYMNQVRICFNSLLRIY